MKKKNKVVKIILFIAAVIGLTYLANLIINMLATKDHKLSSSPEDFYRWKDSKVYYRKKGSGKPLLLLHNLAADSSAFEWSKVFDTLAKNHTVYVLDLPGCGRSDKEKLTYVGYYYVQLIHSFTADVIGEKTDVAATGNTASIALSACLSDNSLLDKVVMINPLSIEKQKKGRPVNAIICKYILEIPVLGTLIYNILNSRNNIDLSFTENILYNPFHADADIIDTYHEAAHLGDGAGRYLQACLVSGYLDVDPTHALQVLKNSLFIIGGHSEDSINIIIEEYKNLNEGIRSTLIANAKTLPQLEEPDVFAAELEKLLAD